MCIKGMTGYLRSLPWLFMGTLTLLAAAFLPALFHNESVLQIRVSRQGLVLPDGFYIYQRLSAEGIRIKSITPGGDAMVVTLESQEQNTTAIQTLYKVLPPGFTIAQVGGKAAIQLAEKNQGKLTLGQAHPRSSDTRHT